MLLVIKRITINIMNENEKRLGDRETMIMTYNNLITEQYKELRSLASVVEKIELERKYLGDWESNRQLQALSKRQIKVLYKIRHLEEEIEHIHRGRREFDLFVGI